jgi:hypothetical protein
VAQTAVRLRSSEVVVGESAKMAVGVQAGRLGEAWDRVPGSADLRTRLVACRANGDLQTFPLGPHAPMLTSDDIDLIHRLWLKAVGEAGLDVHHRDVVRLALEDLDRQWEQGDRAAIAARFQPSDGGAEGGGRDGTRR